ncbi:MAG TPA: hypothetical protein QF683_18155 [SAR324 cluster bacterium]|nr:hypothetical protein [SAR324 cluster bacterium]
MGGVIGFSQGLVVGINDMRDLIPPSAVPDGVKNILCLGILARGGCCVFHHTDRREHTGQRGGWHISFH